MDNFDAVQDEVSAALVATIRSATSISKEDILFHCTLDPSVQHLIDEQKRTLSSIARRLLKECSSSKAVSGLRFDNTNSIDTNWNLITEVLDDIFEKADRCIDTFSGIVKSPEPHHDPPNTLIDRSLSGNHLFRNPRLLKPQLNFDTPPDNLAIGPFKPLLKTKVHSLSPLCNWLSTEGGYPHPYEEEIKSYTYPLHVCQQSEPIKYQPFETTTATYVDNLDALTRMVDELKSAKEIAIDLEHHDTHSYIGIVSLMQISTRARDWIIDTLKPWRQNLVILNEVFADPSILKVLHGAQMDIIWLQRDFGLYIVGLFDTYHASRVLKYSGGSLSFLLKKFVGFEAQKQYQLADWRIRPLPPALLDYARSDTHFLLYIYDCMRNELAEHDGVASMENCRLERVLDRSKETSLQRYEYPYYDELTGTGRGGWLSLIEKNPISLSRVEFAVFRRLHKWRDTIARQVDESTGEIMPNHMLLNIAKNLPTDPATVGKMLQTSSSFVLSRLKEITDIVNEVSTSEVKGPELMEVLLPSYKLSKPQAPSFGRRVQSHTIGAPRDDQKLEAPVIRTPNSLFWGQTLSESSPVTRLARLNDEGASEDCLYFNPTSHWEAAKSPEPSDNASSLFETSNETNKSRSERVNFLTKAGETSVESAEDVTVSDSSEIKASELKRPYQRLLCRSIPSDCSANQNTGTLIEGPLPAAISNHTNFIAILDGLNEGHKRKRSNPDSPLWMEEQVPQRLFQKTHTLPGKSFTFR